MCAPNETLAMRRTLIAIARVAAGYFGCVAFDRALIVNGGPAGCSAMRFSAIVAPIIAVGMASNGPRG